MGKKLSELIEATAVAITDIFHLRTTGGIDKKITGKNLIDTSLNLIFTTKGDLVTRGTSIPERIAGGAYGTKLTAQGAGELSIFEPISRVRVTKNNAQVIGTASATIVQYDDEVFDNLNEFASYKFTASKTGYYLVSASLQSADNIWLEEELWMIRLYKNGSYVSSGSYNQIAGTITAAPFIAKLTDIIYLAATDYIDIRCYQTDSGAVNTSTDVYHNYFAVHRLS